MKILIIGKVWPEPTSSAAGRRMKQLISLLQQKGEVHFACANASTGHEINLTELGVFTKNIELNNDSVNAYFQDLQPDVVVFDRFITEEQYGWRVMEACPHALRILNTEDLHFLRKTRQQYVKKTQQIASSLDGLDFQNEETARELAAIYRCDWNLIISPFEMELLTKQMKVPSETLFHFPIFTEEKKQVNNTATHFLFVGNFLHEPNADAVRMLVEGKIWEQIHVKIPQAQLLIVGAYPNQHFLQMQNEKRGIRVLEHAENMEEIYAQTRVSLVPLRFGAGIKGKILESIEFGVPFVSTSIGAEGMYLEKLQENCMADSWDIFIEKAVNLYQNETVREQVISDGNEILNSSFSQEKWASLFLQQFDNVYKTYLEQRKQNYFSFTLQHHSVMSTRYLSKWIMEKNNK